MENEDVRGSGSQDTVSRKTTDSSGSNATSKLTGLIPVNESIGPAIPEEDGEKGASTR